MKELKKLNILIVEGSIGKVLQKKLNISKSMKDGKEINTSNNFLKKLNILTFEWFLKLCWRRSEPNNVQNHE